MSYLAECYDGGETRLSSQDIANKRDISKPLVAKLLVVLSQANLIEGAPGPRGGYALAKEAEEISLIDIVSLFEKTGDQVMCPFGPNWCGNEEPCPLHDKLVQFDQQLSDFLEQTTLAVFQKNMALPQ